MDWEDPWQTSVPGRRQPAYVALRCILRIILTIAALLMAVLATYCGACCAGVPTGHIKSATKTHVPVVEMFCVIFLPGGRCLDRRLGSSGRWWCCSIRCTILILIATRLPALPISTSSTSSATVGSASATSNGWYICLRWLIHRRWLICWRGWGWNGRVRCLGHGRWGNWRWHTMLLISSLIGWWPCWECLGLHLRAGLCHECHLLLSCDHCLPGCCHLCAKSCHFSASSFLVCIMGAVDIHDRFVNLLDAIVSFCKFVRRAMIRIVPVETAGLELQTL